MSGINPLAKYLIGAGVVLVVVAAIYGIMTSGIKTTPATETVSTPGEDSINPRELEEEAAARPTPAVSVLADPVAVVEQRTQATPAATHSPAAQATPDAVAQWRQQKRLKAFEAPIMIAAFESSDRHVRELSSHQIDGANQSHLHPPASPFTIMEGAHISAVLISGVNSDYPGPITAQVERPLYDSASGRYLLIPPGSKVIGSFQQPTGPLADRVAVSWHRLIFPDTSSLDLPEVPSTDAQGYAALTGDVNSHYASRFGAAFLVSILSIAPTIASTLAFSNSAQVSPLTGGVYHDQVNQQVASQAMTATGSQMGATTSQFLTPHMNRPKTIKLSPGFTFDIFVTRDLSLPGPYQDHAGQLIDTVQRQGD